MVCAAVAVMHVACAALIDLDEGRPRDPISTPPPAGDRQSLADAPSNVDDGAGALDAPSAEAAPDVATTVREWTCVVAMEPFGCTLDRKCTAEPAPSGACTEGTPPVSVCSCDVAGTGGTLTTWTCTCAVKEGQRS